MPFVFLNEQLMRRVKHDTIVMPAAVDYDLKHIRQLKKHLPRVSGFYYTPRMGE